MRTRNSAKLTSLRILSPARIGVFAVALSLVMTAPSQGDFATSGRRRAQAAPGVQPIFGGVGRGQSTQSKVAPLQEGTKSIYHDPSRGQGDPFLNGPGNENDPVAPASPRGSARDASVRDDAQGWIHPSVVRVRSEESDGISNGSGTLIGVDGKHGYVITNWHVVKGASGTVSVEFPDGFQSAATVMKMDSEWDLAILVIWKPTAPPMPLSPHLPSPGEPLIIAGYGQGAFRSAEGTMTEFVAPSESSPFEMFEVSTAARQGDSGGPIVNKQGQLAGVLFGAGDGRTTGSHVGRLRVFLDEAFRSPAATQKVAAAEPLPSERSVAQQPAAFHQTPESEMDRLAVEAAARLPGMPNRGNAVLTDATVEIPSAALPQQLASAGPSVVGAELYGANQDADDLLAGIPLASPREYGLPGLAGANYGSGYPSSSYRGDSAFGDLKTFFTMFGIFAVVFVLLPRNR